MTDSHLKHITYRANRAIHELLTELMDDGMADHISAQGTMLLVACQALDALGAAMDVEIELIMGEEGIESLDKAVATRDMIADTMDSLDHMVRRLPKLSIEVSDGQPAPDNVVPFNKGELH
jgi:hypothetical protein